MEKILLCVEKELKDELKREAKENHLTLSAYVRKILYERGK